MLIVIAILCITIFVLYCWCIEPASLRIHEETVTIADSSLTQPVRLLLLTDFHCAWYTREKLVAAHLADLLLLQRSRPADAILLGGDYIDSNPAYIPLFGRLINPLEQWGVPIMAVLGNHDYHACKGDISALATLFAAQNIELLQNQTYTLPQGVVVAGIEDLETDTSYAQYIYPPLSYAAWKKRAGEIVWYAQLDEKSPELPRVLLGHNPDVVYLPGKVAPTVVLAGHTHGGQIPWAYWLRNLAPRMLPKGSFITWAGRKHINTRELIVSRGIGGSSIPLRFLRPPEVIYITLQPI